MSLDELHQHAQESTPASINIPKTWSGVAAWAIGQFGPGAVFLLLLIPVYLDLKVSNQQFVEISSANIRVISDMSQQLAELRREQAELRNDLKEK